MLSIAAKLLYLPAYQNQGTLEDYISPWISIWSSQFIEQGLSKNSRELISKNFPDESDLDELVRTLPSIENDDLGESLLQDWADWILSDIKRKNIIRKELNLYFFWKDKPFWETVDGDIDQEEMILWKTGENMPETPQEAFNWFKMIFSEN